MLGRRAVRASLLASASLLAVALGSARGAVVDHPNGSTDSDPIVLIDNATQLQVLSGNATQSGVISESGGSFGLEKIGAGTLVLSGNNSFSGAFTLNGGTVSAAHNNALGTGLLSVMGSTLDIQNGITLSNDIELQNDLTINVGTGATGAHAGFIFETGGSFGIIKTGAGILLLSGGVPGTYTGVTEIDSGTLRAGADNVLAAFSDFTVASGATLDLGGFNQDILSLSGSGTVINSGGTDATLFVGFFAPTTSHTVFSGIIQDGGANKTALQIGTPGSLTLTGASTYTGGTVICNCATLRLGDGGTTGSILGDVVNGGTLVFDRSDDFAFTGNISAGAPSTGAVVQNGSGILTLSGSNSYAGGTTINSGTILITADANLGDDDSVLTLNGGTLKTSSGTFSSTFDLDSDRNVVLGSNGGTFDVASGDLVVEGGISGAGALTVTGASGILELYGTNSYQGGTVVTGGAALITEADDNFGLSTADITLDNGSLWFFDNVTLGGGRTVTLGAGGGTFLVDATESTIAGIITGSGSLIVGTEATLGSGLGGGLLRLTGANEYSGGTILAGDSIDGIPVALAIRSDGNLGDADGDLNVNLGGILFEADMTLNANRAVTLTDLVILDTDVNTVTIAGAISGNAVITKYGTGTLVLTGTNTQTGDIDIFQGTLQIGAGGTTGSLGATTVFNDGTLAFNRSDTLVFAGDILGNCGCGGGGAVVQMGGGITIVTGTSDYSGGTTISAGTLQVGNGGTAGSITGDVVNNGALAFNRSDDISFGGAISGSGRVTKSGAGTLTLTGSNSYAGGTTINAGTVTLSGSGTLGGGGVSLSGALGAATSLTAANAITFNAGGDSRVLAAMGATFNLTGNLTFNNDMGRTVYIGSVSDTGVVNVAPVTVTVGADAGALEIVGGTLRDSLPAGVSNFVNTPFTYALGKLSSVTINSGATLEINSAGNGRNALDNTAIKLFGSGSLVMGGNVPRVVLGNSNFAGQISGNGYVAIGGAAQGTLPSTAILTGENNYAVEFQIAANSVLQIGNGGTAGSINATAHIVGYDDTFNDAPVFRVFRSDNVTVGNRLIGSFVLQQAGSGILTVSGSSTFNGSVIVSAGGLSISSNSNLSGVPIALSNATILYTTASGTYASGVSIAGSAALNVANGTTATWSGTIQNGSGAGALRATGGGTLILTAAASHSGGTLVDAGTTLQIGNGGTGGSISGGITNNGILAFNRSNDIAFVGAISGTGGLSKSGAGKLTLSGSNNFSGGITVAAGTVSFATSAASGTGTITTTGSVIDYANGISLGNSIIVGSNTTQIQALSGVTATQLGAISETGGARPLEKIGAGTIILAGASSYTGTTTITAGTIQLGNGGTTGSIAGNVIANGTLVINRSDAIGFASIVSGTGGITQAGSGTTTLTAASTYTGTTRVTAGVLRLGAGGSLGGGNLVIDGGRFDLNGQSITVSGLTGAGGILDLGTGTLGVSSASNTTLATDISGSGSLIKSGTGTLVLAGNNSFSGGITIAGGTVSFATGNSTGTGPITTTGSVIDYANGVTINVPIIVNSNTTQLQVLAGTATQAGVISETGGPRPLEKIGAGTLVLTGANTYSGVTTISGGLIRFSALNNFGTGNVALNGGGLQWAAGATTDISGRLNVLGAAGGTLDTNGNNVTLTAGIGGTGSLTKAGGGMLTLTGASTYNGATAVNAGTLAVNGSIASSAVTVASGATLGGSGTVGNAVIQSGGTLSPGDDGVGTLTVNGNLTLQSGAALGMEVSPGGADLLTINGNATLGGSLFANFQTGVTYTPATYTLIDTTGTVSGTFSSFNTLGIPTGYLANITYGANSVVLNLAYADFIWKASPGSTDWNTAGNWQNGLVPAAGTTANFASSSITNVTINANTSAGTIQLNSSAPHYDFRIGAGGALSLSGGVVQLNAISSSFIASDGGTLAFTGTGNAASSFLIANFGGTISFAGTADAGAAARVTADSGGVVDFSATTGTAGDNQVSAGSIAGQNSSSIRLGANTLTTGALNSSTQFSGVISGSGGLVKTGTGTLILSGANSYAGGTTIAAGTLQFNFGASVPGNIVNNANLVFNLGNVNTYAGMISGAGAVRVAGGDLTFTGANSYTGGTTIDSAANLRIGNGGTKGAIAGNVVNNGLLAFNRSDNVTFAGVISGTGTVFQNGAGILTFTGANTYTGTTRIDLGTLQIGNGGTIGWVAGDVNITNGGTLVFNRSDAVTFAGTISGSTGKVTKSGANTLILTVASTYAGDTTITAGTLQLGNGGTTGSIAGNIVNNGILAFNRSNDLLIAGSITGAGSVQQNGAGTTTLTGASTYTGATTVNAGGLVVNGSITSNVTLAGGILQGTGSIGSLTAASGSTLAPGNSIGTLTVNGNLSLAANSTYAVEAAPNAADLTIVTGTAALNGILSVSAASGFYAPGTNLTILTGGSVTGSFASVAIAGPAGLRSQLVYNATSVQLLLSSGFTGLSANQIAVAGALNGGPAGNSLQAALGTYVGANPSQERPMLDNVSGEIYAAMRGAAFDDSRLIRHTVQERVVSPSEGTMIWGRGLSDHGWLKSDGNAAEARRGNTGFIGGIDADLGDGLRAGLGGAYIERKLNVSGRASRASGNRGSLLAYLSYRNGPVALHLGGDYGWGDVSVARDVAALNETESATRGSEAGEIFGQISYDFGLPFVPYAGFTHVSVSHEAFSESGGLAALSGAAADDSLTYSNLGVRIPLGGFDIEGMRLTPRADVGWSHAFDTLLPSQSLSFSTGPAFAIRGAPLGTDAAMVQLGLGLAVTSQAQFSLGYDGTFYGRGSSHGVRGGLDWRF